MILVDVNTVYYLLPEVIVKPLTNILCFLFMNDSKFNIQNTCNYLQLKYKHMNCSTCNYLISYAMVSFHH